MKLLLKRVHLNGHTVGFHPQTQKVKTTFNVSITDSGSERGKIAVYRTTYTVDRCTLFDLK